MPLYTPFFNTLDLRLVQPYRYSCTAVQLYSVISVQSQSLSVSVVSRRIYSYTQRSVSYGKKYSDGSGDGKNYSEGYPKIFVTAVRTAVKLYYL